jgi:hypothetical protein
VRIRQCRSDVHCNRSVLGVGTVVVG